MVPRMRQGTLYVDWSACLYRPQSAPRTVWQRFFFGYSLSGIILNRSSLSPTQSGISGSYHIVSVKYYMWSNIVISYLSYSQPLTATLTKHVVWNCYIMMHRCTTRVKSIAAGSGTHQCNCTRFLISFYCRHLIILKIHTDKEIFW